MPSSIKLLLFCFILFISCQPDERPNIGNIDAKVNIQRFDRALFETDTANFSQEIRRIRESEFKIFFESNPTESFWKQQRSLAFMNELFKDSKVVFENIDKLAKEWEKSYAYARYFFNDLPVEIDLYTYISGLEWDFPVIFVDSLSTAFLSLDLFLGQDHPAYAHQPEYLLYLHDPKYIVTAFIREVLYSRIGRPREDMSLLSDMIYHGKYLYALEKITGQKSAEHLLNYSQNQMQFCAENERIMWRFFLEQDFIFDQREELKRRFINPAPFSKFYMEFDNETPGMIGQWIGWQIVRSYMRKNPEIELAKMLANPDHRAIFAASGYKP
jgi:hypothetical protein